MAGPRISDHALVRFLERAGGLDIESLRLRLQASLARGHSAARALGDCDYLLRADGLVYVVRGETVTTVHTDEDSSGQRAHALRHAEQAR